MDALKIDRCFVEKIHENAQDAAITQAIVMLAKSLELEVIAEGVETIEQAQLLVEQGCHILQGFLYGSGMSGEEIAAILRKRILANADLTHATDTE